MVVAFNPDDVSRFDNFDVLTTTYKTVHSHPITLNVLYPKNFKPAPNGQPVIVRYHGGFLIAGASMFPNMFARWLLELADRHGAIIVSPDYRLLPEANVNDILDDVEDSWQFIQTKLASYLEAETEGKIKPDTSRIMTAGESAGGYLSLILSLSHSHQIRATTAAYPIVDLKDPWFTEHFEKQMFDIPQLPEKIYSDHIAGVKAQEELTNGDGEAKNVVVSSDPRMERGPLMFTMVQRGVFQEYLDYSANKAFPLERLDAGDRLPRGGVLILHGENDSLVPVEQSRKLAKKAKEVQPDMSFMLVERPGDHGFDAETKIDDKWLRGGLDPLVKAWLD